MMNTLTFRQQIQPSDIEAMVAMVESSGFFSSEEVEIAIELAEDRLEKQDISSYHFLFAEQQNRIVGYSCYGPIPATQSSYDLYWIVVSNEMRRMGLGKMILAETEKRIVQSGGRQLYAETSSRNQYEPTQKFYETCGYHKEAFLKDFYAPGDGKTIYSKSLE